MDGGHPFDPASGRQSMGWGTHTDPVASVNGGGGTCSSLEGNEALSFCNKAVKTYNAAAFNP